MLWKAWTQPDWHEWQLEYKNVKNLQQVKKECYNWCSGIWHRVVWYSISIIRVPAKTSKFVWNLSSHLPKLCCGTTKKTTNSLMVNPQHNSRAGSPVKVPSLILRSPQLQVLTSNLICHLSLALICNKAVKSTIVYKTTMQTLQVFSTQKNISNKMSETTKIFYMHMIYNELKQTDFDKFYQTSQEWLPVWATDVGIVTNWKQSNTTLVLY